MTDGTSSASSESCDGCRQSDTIPPSGRQADTTIRQAGCLFRQTGRPLDTPKCSHHHHHLPDPTFSKSLPDRYCYILGVLPASGGRAGVTGPQHTADFTAVSGRHISGGPSVPAGVTQPGGPSHCRSEVPAPPRYTAHCTVGPYLHIVQPAQTHH